MKSLKITSFYVLVIGAFSLLIYWIAFQGSKLESNAGVSLPEGTSHQWSEFTESISYNLSHPLAILLAQIVTVIIVARFFAWIFKKMGQPTVIGEIIAGILLGPSLMGMYFPEFSAALFPAASLSNLQFLSQIGLIMFMFIVGIELDLNVLRNRAHEAVVISHASIVIPFALGMALSYFIYGSFAPEDVSFLSFGLFMGIAMSITAFPVLARIVQERGMHKTKIGTVVITCAAADDITAWCILAAVVAIVNAGSFVSSLYVIVLAVGYVLLMISVVKPFLKRVGDLHTSPENLSKPVVAIFFLTLILSAYVTEVIGIHALFGAFMAGAIMPENPKFRNVFIEKIEDVALVLLLPLFFVFTGLRTEIGLLDDPYLWTVAFFILLVAVAGKFLGSALAAKFVGQTWSDSLAIGALMNTRGLMELVVLNIGYDLGVLSPEIFAMMVIMALITTFMTGPALDLISWAFKTRAMPETQQMGAVSRYKILISFGNPQSGKTLLRLAVNLIKKLNGNATITAMHLTPINELHHYNIDEYERESFAPIIAESQKLNQKIATVFKVSGDIEGDIADVANEGDYDLLLIGVGQSIFSGSLLGKIFRFTTHIINPGKLLHSVTGREKLFNDSPFDERTHRILSKSSVPVGILMDKKLEKVQRVFIPLMDPEDVHIFRYVEKLIDNAGAQITVMDVMGDISRNADMKEVFAAIEQKVPGHITLVSAGGIEKSFLKQQDLMLVSVGSWKKLVDSRTHWLSDIPSALVISDKEGTDQT